LNITTSAQDEKLEAAIKEQAQQLQSVAYVTVSEGSKGTVTAILL